MPSVLDDREEKWLYSPGAYLENGIRVDHAEMLGILVFTDDAESAAAECARHGFKAEVRHCTDGEGKPHRVCQIGQFALDHRHNWPLPLEDLEYTWNT